MPFAVAAAAADDKKARGPAGVGIIPTPRLAEIAGQDNDGRSWIGVAHVYTLKVLRVTLSSHLSASEHIRRVISDSAQSLYALHVLQHHGMNDVGLQTVFRAVVVTRLMYASPAAMERLRYGDGPQTSRRVPATL